jgi:HK97 family phage portal protein
MGMWQPWADEPNNQPRNQPTMIQFLQRLFGRGALVPPLTPDPSPRKRGEGSGRKGAPGVLAGGQWSGTSYVDAWKRSRSPSPNELMAELKGVAWACASINAAVCASNPPALYVASTADDQSAKCPTKAITRRTESRLRAQQHLQPFTKSARQIEEVTSHPLLALLAQANPLHSAFDLWELTTLYLEVHGRAFWYLDLDPVLGMPRAIWPLPAQNVTPRRSPDSPSLIDYYEYQAGRQRQEFPSEQVVFFRYPDPKDPYLGGLSPLRACFEQVALQSEYAATKAALYENRGIPSALISPDDVIGEEERDRLETQWNTKFKRGGAGKVVVAESGVKLQLLQQSLGDLAALADMQATKEDVANAFHVPLSYLTTQTNLANLQAAQTQHLSLAITPRLSRRDEKLNQQLVPLFDPSGRLFLASEIQGATADEATWQRAMNDLKYGVVTVNEVRADRGLAPVPWGDTPWAPPGGE